MEAQTQTAVDDAAAQISPEQAAYRDAYQAAYQDAYKVAYREAYDAAFDAVPPLLAMHDPEFPDASERAEALKADHMRLEKIICHSASDYYCATKRPEFANHYGGIERFRETLFKLLDEWHSGARY